MARIYQSGALNTSALTVPDLYVQIVQPQTVLNGVVSDRIGIVGTASWGPVNEPIVIGTMGDVLAAFGAKQAQATDLGTAVNIAILQGAADFRGVRVTDGTDTAAKGTLAGATITAAYTGASGNGIVATLSAVGAIYTLTVAHPVIGSRSYAGTTWAGIIALANADASPMVVVSGGAALSAGAVTLSGGANGGAPATTAFVGTDGTTRTGMYALRGTGCSVGILAGLTDSASWSVQQAFGAGEGVYMIACGPSGDSISNATATIGNAGVSSGYSLKVMFGDWLWWQDDTNGLMLVPPQAFAAGEIASLSPEQSSLNKPLTGIVGSQKAGQSASGGSLTYSSAELTALIQAGIDVISYPAPGGAYWACRSGHNCSTRAAVWSDSYTRMTNYLAETLAGGMGVYVGQAINTTLFGNIRASILGLLSNMLGQGLLARTIDTAALPYTVVCDATNNTQARIAEGYVQCDVSVQYQGINEKFVVNLQGGASVSITTSSGSV